MFDDVFNGTVVIIVGGCGVFAGLEVVVFDVVEGVGVGAVEGAFGLFVCLRVVGGDAIDRAIFIVGGRFCSDILQI
ncbi:MAG: hypothetical protein U9532_00795 ['Conium maculatum' witches'-broom phytoplasma]|nr:hypothetical protein ['Conium maculatum' witches'-broom phytoplasma]